ncbi:outer membrane protein assembly factor BamB family protein [Natrinema gari]|uniref:outer membrane protein assembly factor BamB family protein n=1 Tax=Natrinema gari TaxID=419186 RepID=UPI00187DA44C|nr:PQQ-binding-like beta-propeller repeat protein [Natrinema gari]
MSGAAGCLGTTGGDDVERLEPERELWSFEADGRLPTTPAVASGRIHVASLDRNVYALDPETGEAHWRFETDNAVIAAPAVTDDAAYVASNDGRVYALDVT